MVAKHKNLGMNNCDFKPLEIENLDYSKFENVFLDSIKYDTALTIVIINKFYKINIVFNRFVSYRVVNESNLMTYWELLYEKNINGWVFYKILNSAFHSELKSLSYNFLKGNEDTSYIENYGFFTLSECVEVLSEIEPDIQIERIRW